MEGREYYKNKIKKYMQRKASVADYYKGLTDHFRETIMRTNNKYILETDTSGIISELMKSESILIPVEFDSTRKETMKSVKEMRIPPHNSRDIFAQHNNGKSFEYETLWIAIPIVPNVTISNIKSLNTSTRSMSWDPSDFNWGKDNVSLSIDIKGFGFKLEDDRIIIEVGNLKKRVSEWVGWVNTDIQRETEAMKQNLTTIIDNRKKSIVEDTARINNLSEKMGISLE